MKEERKMRKKKKLGSRKEEKGRNFRGFRMVLKPEEKRAQRENGRD